MLCKMSFVVGDTHTHVPRDKFILLDAAAEVVVPM